MTEIHKNSEYRGYKVYSGPKADEGLILPMVDWMIEAIEIVKEEHHRPIAFHMILNEPNFKKLKELPGLLKRFAKRRKKDTQHSETIYYIIGHEVRPRNKQRHSHLWVFCDNFHSLERSMLADLLERQGYAEKVKIAMRDKSLFGTDWQGNVWYHSVRVEPDDMILRASYITKHATKTEEKRRRWSASVLPRAKPEAA